LVVGCGSDDDSSNPSNTIAGNNGGRGQPAVVVDTNLEPDIQNLRVAALPDGGVAVAGINLVSGAFAAAFSSDLTVEWASDLPGFSRPTGLVVDSEGRLVLTGASGEYQAVVIRLDPADGSFIDGKGFRGFDPPDLLPDENGGLVLSAGIALDTNLDVRWTGEARGESVIATDDGYLFGTATETDGGLTGTGIVLRKTDKAGKIQWRSYASPGPGQHQFVGLRTFADGRIFAAISNDAADSRNVASGAPMVTTIFTADGAHEGSNAVDMLIMDADGREVPLAFGGALDLATRGATTFAAVIANSGVFGSDIRTRTTVEFDGSGTPVGSVAVSGGLTVSSEGDLLIFDGSLVRASTVSSICEATQIESRLKSFEPVASFSGPGDVVPQVIQPPAAEDFEPVLVSRSDVTVSNDRCAPE
jgi:hypothetical protein